jgi:predicted amidophosphoribosyltransferase
MNTSLEFVDQCPRCDLDLEDFWTSCVHCGFDLVSHTMTAPAPFADSDVVHVVLPTNCETVSCGSCDQSISDEALVCPHCGIRFDGREDSESSIQIADMEIEDSDSEESVCTGCGGQHCYCSEYSDDL